MIIYIDENLPPQLAEGLNKLQEPLNRKNNTDLVVKSIKTVFGEGTQDEDWIPIAGAEKAIAITQDIKIQTTRHQKELYENYGLGIFFFSSKGLKYWQIVKTIIDKWEDILKTIESSKAPYAYRFTVRGSKMEKLDE
ncbi:MAG: hypothetical protein Q8S54_10430 [Bacteroidota bacterium]|nr:hypothetical protein [Odoribacter sp.]MDP3643591.1 hypothetical protein [Bacteroidota bacterium]